MKPVLSVEKLYTEQEGAVYVCLVVGASVIMAKKRMTAKQLANLPQYRGLSEEELEKVVDNVRSGGLEGRIAKVLKSFETDYDLSDMTANDMLSLRELAKISVMLDQLSERQQDILNDDEPDLTALEKIDRMAARLRATASTIQGDLNITRKARKEQSGESVHELLTDLKKRAKHFLADRLAEIYCPKCGMLIAKVWFLYPEQDNKITLSCGRKRCRKVFTVSSSELKSGKNIEIGPPL